MKSVYSSAVLACVVLIASCAAPGPGQRRSGDIGAEAQSAYELGQYDIAAELYEQMAREGRGDRAWLRAADSAWLSGDDEQARRNLLRLQRDRLSPEQRRLASLLSLLTGEVQPVSPTVRLSILGRAENWPDGYRSEVHSRRAAALAENGQVYEGALERIAYGQWLQDPFEREANRAEILRMMTALSSGEALELMRQHRPDEPIYGWLALVADIKTSLVAGRTNLAEVIASWRLRFPHHPATGDPLEDLVGIARDETRRLQTIGVLLPFSGRFAGSARAVRDGLLSAYLSDPGRTATLRFYDTGGAPDGALRQYEQAIADGAEQIIGPLERDAVTAVMLQADGRVPLLALNHPSADAPPTLAEVAQFGLLPEQEGRFLARRMLADGLLRVAVLATADSWGERVSSSFVDQFIAMGGVVLDVQRFSPAEQDHGARVSHLVGTTDAELRRRQVARTLGFSVSFEAQPRHDLDGIFLASQPESARLIKPQLAFYNAADIPVYATSHIFNGRRTDADNRDLNGIVFCDAPFLLRDADFTPTYEQARRDFPEVSGAGARLFAVGLDAYRILPYLRLLGLMGTDLYSGATGRLSLDRQGRIQRSLECARFASTRVVPLREALTGEQ